MPGIQFRISAEQLAVRSFMKIVQLAGGVIADSEARGPSRHLDAVPVAAIQVAPLSNAAVSAPAAMPHFKLGSVCLADTSTARSLPRILALQPSAAGTGAGKSA